MNSIKNILIENKIINDVFEYHDLDLELANTYAYFDARFQSLFEEYANAFNIKNHCFYIRNDNSCNAFASKIKDYNIIGITNGYPILIKSKFNEKYFSLIFFVGVLTNNQATSEAYCDLEEDQNFKFNEFMLDCSIRFTFAHEFRHILQFNNSKISLDFRYNESFDKIKYRMKKHAWEFDADRSGAFQVVQYVYHIHRKLENKNNEKLKCLLYIGLASVIITQSLFYFNVMNQLYPNQIIQKRDFYTKKYSHPHSLVRIHNIFDYFITTVIDDFPHLKLEVEQVLINVFQIVKIYFNSLIPNQELWRDLFNNLFSDEILKYNQELYYFAIKDKAIKRLLEMSGGNV